jgi:APA family basic amino acid/polyamine antiporter
MSTRVPSQAEPSAASPAVFVRRSSGLVREVSAGNAWVGNMLIANLMIGAVTLLLVPYSFPGANIGGAILLSAIPAVFLATVYVLFGIAMPRSGGDYVYISRTLHPALGFAANFSFFGWNCIWIGVYANWAISVGLKGAFASLAIATGSKGWTDAADWVAKPGITFLLATIALGAVTLVCVMGLRTALRAQKIMFGVALVGVLVAILAVLFTSRASFAEGLADQGTSVNGIMSAAEAAGFKPPGSWTEVGPTILAVGLVSLLTLFVMYSAYYAGELKEVKRSVPISMYGALATVVLIFVAMAYAATSTWGHDFIASINTLWIDAPDKYPLASSPDYNYLEAIGNKSLITTALIGIGFIVYPAASLIANFVVNSRCLFAWAFDRLLPQKAAYVSPRTHSPVLAIVIVAVLGEISLATYTFFGSVKFLGGTTMGYISTFATTALAAVVFPYVRKTLYEDSPVKPKVFGVPLITVAGAGTLIMFAVMIYGFLTNDVFGANVPEGLAFFVGLWIVGLVLFLAARTIRSRQGLPMDVALRELPPE